MALTKGSIAGLMLFFFWSGIVYAQNVGPPVQLGKETQSLEHTLSLAATTLAERYDALVRLARLRQLSGNIADAAACWLDAFAVNPRDDASLISGAYCLAAIGEWEKAASAIRPLLDSGMQGPPILQARYLDAFLKARTANDVSDLVALTGNAEFAALHPLIYYSLWQIMAGNPGIAGRAAGPAVGPAEVWKARLLEKFPHSPEARAAGGPAGGSAGDTDKNAPSISAVQNPLWLLLPGDINSSTFGQSRTAPPPATPPPAGPPSAGPPSAGPPLATPPPAGNASTVVLQAGLFSREANARARAEALQKAGFSASIQTRTVNGEQHWVVTVPAGQDQKKTIDDLKKAGFDSFPIR